MAGDREVLEDGERYRVVHRFNHPYKQPRYVIWDKQREIGRFSFWYPPGDGKSVDELREEARENALSRFKKLEEEDGC